MLRVLCGFEGGFRGLEVLGFLGLKGSVSGMGSLGRRKFRMSGLGV